jgi:hypothetical protein
MPIKSSKRRPKKSPKLPAALKLRSGFEKKVATKLTEKKIKFGYESLRLPYLVPPTPRTYTPDFTLPNGIIVEAKGKFDRDSRKKMALIIEQYPDKDIRMLFMRNNPINKGSKTTYTDWCEERGIKYHVSLNGEIPDEWLQ